MVTLNLSDFCKALLIYSIQTGLAKMQGLKKSMGWLFLGLKGFIGFNYVFFSPGFILVLFVFKICIDIF